MHMQSILNTIHTAFHNERVPYSESEKQALCASALEEASMPTKSNAPQESAQYIEALSHADTDEHTLLSAIRRVRLNGELPYYLTMAAACMLLLSSAPVITPGVDLKEHIRRRWNLFRAPETVKLIADHYMRIQAKADIEGARKIELIKQAYRDGYYYEKHYRGCAQCAIAALFNLKGETDEKLFRAANGFAAGMGLFGDGVCGGYAGGLLFMGTYAGRRIEHFDDDKAQKDLSMHLAQRLHTLYIDTYGSVICHDIHKDIFGRPFFIRDADEKIAFEDAGAHTQDKCTAVVATASAWTAQIMIEEGFIPCGE